jgi:hypothetical protein
METDRFRLKQHGIPVAWTEGLTALAEIYHYAMVYSQDAPVMIEQRVKGRWRKWRDGPACVTPNRLS